MYFNYLLLILFFVNPILVLASPPETASATPLLDSRVPDLSQSILGLSHRTSKMFKSIGSRKPFKVFLLSVPISIHDLSEKWKIITLLNEGNDAMQEQILSCLMEEGFIDFDARYRFYLNRTGENLSLEDTGDAEDLYGYNPIDKTSVKCVKSVFGKFFSQNRITSTVSMLIRLTSNP
jgi:hypothetical protein